MRAVERACAGASGGRELRVAVLAALRGALDFDWYVWVLTDPETSVGIDPLAEVPDLADLPRLITRKYASSVNRWTTLADVATSASRARSDDAWVALLAGHGVVDVASTVQRDRHGCWGFLDLWSTSRPYAADDLALLRDLQPVVTEALRRAQAETFAVPPRPQPGAGPAVVLLEEDAARGLVVTGSTPGSDEWLARLLPPGPGLAPVPAAALNVAAQLLAREGGVDDSEPLARVHVGNGTWLRLRASRVQPAGHVAVTIEIASPAERVDLFCRAHALTPRERHVLESVVAGADTHETATRLFISPNTVQDNLKAVFDKAGVHSRRELMTRVLGLHAPG